MLRRTSAIALLLLLALAPGARAQQAAQQAAQVLAADRQAEGAAIAGRLEQLRSQIQPRFKRGGVLALMGYGIIPDGSSDSLFISRSTPTSGLSESGLQYNQYGFGYTIDEENFPLYLENYAAVQRYNPRFLFAGESGYLPAQWNNFTMTLGIGWDFRIAENLYIRPILNGAWGYATSDAGLASSLLNKRFGTNVPPLARDHVNVHGLGAGLTLAYYDHKPKREIDVEIRYSQFKLETYGGTVPAARGTSYPSSLTVWGRYRWPTGVEAFGRPLRWVSDNNFSWYTGDQRATLGYAWAFKVGGGIEFDVGRYEVSIPPLSLERVRLLGYYFFADNNVRGYSIALGFSF